MEREVGMLQFRPAPDFYRLQAVERSDAEALFHGSEAVRFARQLSDREGQQLLFDSLVNLGMAAERIGEYSRALAAYQEALSLPVARLGRRAHVEAVWTYIGYACYYRGDYQEALAAFDQAGRLAGERQDPYADEGLHSFRGGPGLGFSGAWRCSGFCRATWSRRSRTRVRRQNWLRRLRTGTAR